MSIKTKIFISLALILFIPFFIRAQKPLDSDNDGIQDKDELEIYHTKINNPDTDGDGYSDWMELNNGYSPHNPKPVKLENNDYDDDGLSDRMELNFGTNLTNPDSDNDGFKDGVEIKNGFNPLNKSSNALLEKRIEINTAQQELSYFLGGVRMGSLIISSGVPTMPTPNGHFTIETKHPKAWSKYGLWMPFWMSFKSGKYGIHELPVWPNGAKEGEDKLGTPASHGCVRLGHDDAELLYNWAPIGTKIFIY